jgi:hypothetical protein
LPAELALREQRLARIAEAKAKIGAQARFAPCDNAQAAVAAGFPMLVVAAAVVRAVNDKQQVAPMLDHPGRLPDALGRTTILLADSGYLNAESVAPCAVEGVEPSITMGRQRHHLSWRERLAGTPPPPEAPTPLDAMRHRLATPDGRKLRSAQATARTGVRHHQAGNELPAVSPAGP